MEQRPRRGVEDVGRAGVGLRRVVEGGADDGDCAGRGDGVAEEVVVGGRGIRERLDEGAGTRVEEVRRAGTGGAACVERRADDDRVARRGEREAEEVVEGGGRLGERADSAALEEEDRTRVGGAAVEVRRADQEVGADGGDRGAELVARGGRRLEERGQERARRRVEEVGGARVAGGGVVEARADEQVAAGERHGGAEEVVLGGRGVEECGRPSGARQEHEDEEAGQRPDPASVARRSGPGRCGTRRLPIPGGATGVPGRVGVAARRRPGAQRSPIR